MFELFSPTPDGKVRLVAPEHLMDFVCEQANIVEHVLHTPSDPTFYRLCGPINVEVSEDDVFSRLEREMTIEALCAKVRSSVEADSLDVADLEAWLSVLSMALGVVASKLGVVDDDARDNVPVMADTYFTASNFLQCSVIEAIESLTE